MKTRHGRSRCTTGLRIKTMTGVTVMHSDGRPVHYTMWTLRHGPTLLAFTTTFQDMLRHLEDWTTPEAHELTGAQS